VVSFSLVLSVFYLFLNRFSNMHPRLILCCFCDLLRLLNLLSSSILFYPLRGFTHITSPIL
jgi:hypothetical protein